MPANTDIERVQEFLLLLDKTQAKLGGTELARKLGIYSTQIHRWLSSNGCTPSKRIIARLLPKLQEVLKTIEEKEVVIAQTKPAEIKRTTQVDEYGAILSTKAEVSIISQTIQKLADLILFLEAELDSIQVDMERLQARHNQAHQELAVANQTVLGLKALYRKEESHE